jgi:hypothetical protein
MKQPEYREGPEALENFRRLATVILQAPARKKKKKALEKPASSTPFNFPTPFHSPTL